MSSPPSYQSFQSAKKRRAGTSRRDDLHALISNGSWNARGRWKFQRTRRAATHAGRCLERWKEIAAFDASNAEEEEPLPARIATFQERVQRSCNGYGWWHLDSPYGVYAMYTGYIEPWQQRLEQAGFGEPVC